MPRVSILQGFKQVSVNPITENVWLMLFMYGMEPVMLAGRVLILRWMRENISLLVLQWSIFVLTWMIRELIKVFLSGSSSLWYSTIWSLSSFISNGSISLNQDAMDLELDTIWSCVMLVEILNHFQCDWMVVYFHYTTYSASVNCFLPMQIHREMIQCSFCVLFFDNIRNKWYKRAALFSVCIVNKWEPDHSSTKIKSWFIPTNDQIPSVALVATGSIIIWYCNRFSLLVKRNIASGHGHAW